MAHSKSINMGSVSCATMRPEDLIPAFVYELANQKPLRRDHYKLSQEISARMNKDGYYQTDDADYDLEELFDALNEYCAPYFYFGAHPGDGADYGYWLSEDFEQRFEDDGGLKVNDLADVPRAYTGEVLLVNDHGNCSLYRYSRGRHWEVWSVV